ncbi:MAG: NB-ARC domain-containing protein [Kibdelosporangium sp.]
MSFRRKQAVAAASVTVLSILVAVAVNLLTSGWSWVLLAVLAVLSAVWVVLAMWQSTPGRPRQLAPVLPGTPGAFVARPDITDQIIRRLLASRTRKVGITTAITGAGGFGKTTLAHDVCQRPEIQQAFDKIYYATVGQEVSGAALADIINDVSEQIENQRPGLTRPEQAGTYLGTLLNNQGRSLLLVDDVWTAQQLRPFLNAGRGCTLLITTRIPSLLPGDSELVEVDQMTRDQARALLTNGVTGLPEASREQLLDITGRWPLALSLTNGALRSAPDVEAAAQGLVRRLRELGPAALDVTDAARRERTVAATLEASLSLLDARRDQVVELAIFPEDMEVPQDLVALLWSGTAGLSADETDVLCGELAQLSVITRLGGPPRLRLHDVVRSYLRNEGGPDRLVKLHNAFLRAAAGSLPDPQQRPVAWWTMPTSAEYLWRTLAYHLAGAGRTAELAELITEPQWVIGKLSRFGPVAVAEDLGTADTGRGRELSRFLEQVGHLLTPTTPGLAVVNALAHRLEPYPALADLREVALSEVTAEPRLVPYLTMPDLPDPALNRVLLGHEGEVNGCVFAPDGSWLASVSDDRTIRVWNPGTGQLVHVLQTRHRPRRCSMSPDGKWLAAVGRLNGVQLWDTTTWQVGPQLTGHRESVDDCLFLPDSRTLITIGADRTMRLWEAESGQRIRSISTPETLAGFALLTGGRALTVDSAGASIWDLGSGEHTAFPVTGHPAYTACVASPDGRWGVLVEYKELAVHDLDDLNRPTRILSHQAAITAAEFSPDGSALAVGGGDGTITIWNTGDWRVRARISAHATAVRGVTCNADGTQLASAGADNTVRLWNPDLARYTVRAGLLGDRINGCVAAADGAWLAVSTSDEVKVYDPATGEFREAPDFAADSFSMAYSPATDSLIVNSYSSVLICTPGSWRDVRRLGVPSQFGIRRLSTGGTLLGVGRYGDEVAVWDMATWAPPAYLEATVDGVRVIREPKPQPWSGSRLARLRERLPARRDNEQGIDDCAIAPGGEWVAIAVAGRIHVVESGSWITTATLRVEHSADVMEAAPNGRWLAAVDGWRVQLWDTESWQTAGELPEHRAAVERCFWSPNGRLLATIAEDRRIRVFGGPQWACLTEIQVDGELSWGTWLGNGRLAAVGGRGVHWFDYVSGAAGQR